MTRVLFAEEEDTTTSDSSSSDEESSDEDHPDIRRAAEEALLEAQPGPSQPSRGRQLKIKIGDGGEPVCHVCGQRGHFSGFVGATYVDCINKPCYLCGQPGHRTSTCVHRLAPERNCNASVDAKKVNIAISLCERERGSIATSRSLPPNPGRWSLDAAVLKLHARRITCIEYHPTLNNLVFSGDKKGQIAVWDVNKVFERTVYPDINRWLTNSIRFLAGDASNPSHAATASYDGTVKVFDSEVGVPVRTLVDANPDTGWAGVEEAEKKGKWTTFIGLDTMAGRGGMVVAGDSKGHVYFMDPRAQDAMIAECQVHKKGTKVQSVCANPVDNNIVLTAGNDREARVLDVRYLGQSDAHVTSTPGSRDAPSVPNVCEVFSFSHPRVINAAYFSPISGRKILTTAQDNRLRVWDNFTVGGASPDREIVHSHNFSRHLTPFRAEWDPKDASERLAIVGRYISEEYHGLALHPIDLFDVATGASCGALVDPNLTTISPVNKPHPRMDLIVSGSSRSMYAWKPAREDEDNDDEGVAETSRAEGFGGLLGGNGFGGATSKSGGVGTHMMRGREGRPSSHFLFFDADADGVGKKKKARTSVPSLRTPAGVSGGSKQHRQRVQGPNGKEDNEDADGGGGVGDSDAGSE